MDVRKAFMKLGSMPGGESSANPERAKHSQDADGENPCVRAQTSRLELRTDEADEPREIPAAVDAEPVDEAHVDPAPQETARHRHDRLDDRFVVDLVDVVLV